MSKQIFTKTQAVSILEQVKNTTEVDIFKFVDPKHKLFKLTCEELEEKLSRYISQDKIAGVVEEVQQ